MSKVVHFEIPAENLERAQSFYKTVFDWGVNAIPSMSYTMCHTGPTDAEGMVQEKGFINGGMMTRQAPVVNPVITIEVPSIDTAAAEIAKNGGEMLGEKREVSDMGFSAYFKDSEGNVMGLWENK